MKSQTKIIGSPWQLSSLWKEAVDSIPQKPLVKREHCWASELGGAYVDRWLKMNAVPMTNPPNARSQRKFLAGHIFEWIVSFILTALGVLKSKQLRSEVELPGLLKVTGKLDFVAGGLVDWDKAYHEIQKMKHLFSLAHDDAPPIIIHAVEHIYKSMRKQFENKPLMEIAFECKSVSTFMFEKVERGGAMPHQILQVGHYGLANKLNGKICYICKDDCLMQEFDIVFNRALAKVYKEDVATMTMYWKQCNMKNLPPLEPLVLFDPNLYRFEKNFKVEYSSYLKKLYGYDSPKAYADAWTYKISTWNSAFKRAALGQKVTPLNQTATNEVKKWFGDWDKYVYKAKSEGVFLKPQDNE